MRKELQEKLESVPHNIGEKGDYLMNCKSLREAMSSYDKFFWEDVNGKYCKTKEFWGAYKYIYSYIMNRIYRELQRAIRTDEYNPLIKILPFVLDIFSFSKGRITQDGDSIPRCFDWHETFL